MRTVALEEHFSVPALIGELDPQIVAGRGFDPDQRPPRGTTALVLLPDLGQGRIANMDASGITVQVLSNSGPGADLLDGEAGVDLAKRLNEALAGAIAQHPNRFGGFAHLPMRAPDAAAREFERCVTEYGFCGALVSGTTEDKFLDHPSFEPLLSAAEALDRPIYLHPHLAPKLVRHAYYDGMPGNTAYMLEAAGWGWHAETALHILRLVLSGTLDRHPSLKLIIGHMGEGLPAMMARLDDVFRDSVAHLERPISLTITDQVWVTTSGMFTAPPFKLALEIFGEDRLMFSVDYPYADNARGRAFLDSLDLTTEVMMKLCHGNADALLSLSTGTS
ncbi:MAG: amidohydrolase [Hyphomicrobiaceae bacterium]|nr:amidohydrolase [Hyphomicrobiaceae bacterium]